MTKLDATVSKRAPRVLVIADGTTRPGKEYVDVLRAVGFDVFHFGVGSNDLDSSILPAYDTAFRASWNVRDSLGERDVPINIMSKIRYFRLKDLLSLLGKKFDLVFHVQDWQYPIDDFVPLPYFFYCTEAMYPVAPRCCRFVFYATHAIKSMVEAGAPHVKTFAFLPHAVQTNRWSAVGLCKVNPSYPKTERTTKVFFAGEIYKHPGVYEERRVCVRGVKKILGSEFDAHWMGPIRRSGVMREPEEGLGVCGPSEYVKRLLRAKVGLNVPTAGGANFRDVEIPACGAMLVTRHTPDHDAMGFVDGVNCRFFDGTPEDAVEKINAYDPEIAKRGWKLVMGLNVKDGEEFTKRGHTMHWRAALLSYVFSRAAGVKHVEVDVGGKRTK